jgi:hypothetical protein
MARPSQVTIDSGDTFRLRNDHETETLELLHGKRRITVAPGKTALVPFELIRIWWGDPRARPGQFTKFSDSKEAGYINKREAEIMRLGVLYGSYVADVQSLNDPNWPPNDPQYGRVAKRTPWPVTIRDEAGQEIVPCGLDLTGDAIYQGIADDSENLDDQVMYRQHLEREIDAMKERLNELGSPNAQTDDAEVDTPVR